MKLGLLMVFVVIGFNTTAPASNAELSFDESRALATSQAAIGRTLGDYRFVDRHGKAVALVGLRGRPLLINLIYTSCYHTCSVFTKHLENVIDIAQQALGEDSFAVLTIGFDTPNDTVERMASFARSYAIDVPNWYFLSTDSETIKRLIADLGFIFFPSPRGFDHTTQVTIVDAEGQIYRQVYGEYFPPPTLVEPLKQLVFGERATASSLSGWINGVRLLCTIYDPNSGRYTFDYSIFVALFVGIISLSAVGAFIIHSWRQSRRPHTLG